MRSLWIALLLVSPACGSIANEADASVSTDACVPESDTSFCGRLSSACESHTAADNCGTQRTADCRDCSNGQGCVVGTCKTPVCNSFNYTTAPISAFSRPGVEDGLGAATSDGRVVVYVQSQGTCGNFAVIVGDETAPGAGTYTSRNINQTLTSLGLFVGPGGSTIASDGVTLIALSTNSKNFLATKRSAINMTDFGTASATDFAAINAMVAGNTGMFTAPVISADGLEMLFTIGGVDSITNGIYGSVRASASMPFPAGTKLGAGSK